MFVTEGACKDVRVRVGMAAIRDTRLVKVVIVAMSASQIDSMEWYEKLTLFLGLMVKRGTKSLIDSF